MHKIPSCSADTDHDYHALLAAEFNHRIRNLLMAIESAVRHTQSADVEGYRTKLTERISAFRAVYELEDRDRNTISLSNLIERSTRPFSARGAQVVATGPDIQLEPKLALALHLVFHELATNAHKYGALSSTHGCVYVEWSLKGISGTNRKLGIVWSERDGPEVKRARHRGFGSKLIARVLNGYGTAQLVFNSNSVACLIMIALDRSDH